MQQESVLIYIGMAGLGAVVFFMLGYFIRKRYATKKLRNAEERAKKTLENAVVEADKIKHGAELQAKDLLLKMRTEFEHESKVRRQELNVLEKRLMQKEENLDRKVDIIDRKEKDFERRDQSLIEKEKQGVLKIIHEIDIKKKKTFLKTLEALNEIFSRNFSGQRTPSSLTLKDQGSVSILRKI